MNRKSLIRHAIALLCSSAAVANGQNPASSKVDATPIRLAVASRPIAAALNDFARQSGLHVVIGSDIAAGVKSSPVEGVFTPDAALDQLLRDTGLIYEYLDAQTVAVVRKEKPRADLGNAPKTFRVAQVEPASSSRSTERETIDEVVVTAQKREERLQDVPISISVLVGADLDKSTFQGVRETLNTVPGVAITTNHNDSSTVTVRGVSPVAARFQGTGVAGYYLDTIPFSLVKSSIVPDSNAYDLERVEILRGPQGTLYGATALNGVVRVLTEDANPDAFEFKARASISSTEKSDGLNYRGDAAVNVPLIEEKLAARVVAGYQDISGWVDRPSEKDANASENRNVRLKINAQPTEELSVGMLAWSSRISREGPQRGDGYGRTEVVPAEPNSDDYDAYGLKVAYAAPSVAITSMTSYMNYSVVSDTDFTPYGFPVFFHALVDSDVFSQEVLLTSSSADTWKWSMGAIYRDAEDRSANYFPEFSSDPNQNYKDTSKSYAVYGEATRLLLDGQVELTAGLRYFEDRVGLEDRLTATSVSSRFDSVSPRVVLTWHPSDDLTLYSSYAEGFRSGTQQSPGVAALGVPGTEPDTLKNYEIGGKGNLWDGRAAFDAAVYYIDWRDAPQEILIPVQTPAGPILTGALLNSESVSGLGFDFGLTVRPTDGLSLGANFNWNELESDADVFSGTNLLIGKGDRANRSPEVSFGLSADYVIAFGGSGFKAQFAASVNHTSKQLVHAAGVGDYVGDPITLGRASVSLLAPDHWEATLFIDNISNEQDSAYVPAFAGPPPSGLPYMHTRPIPRTIGLQLEYRF